MGARTAKKNHTHGYIITLFIVICVFLMVQLAMQDSRIAELECYNGINSPCNPTTAKIGQINHVNFGEWECMEERIFEDFEVIHSQDLKDCEGDAYYSYDFCNDDCGTNWGCYDKCDDLLTLDLNRCNQISRITDFPEVYKFNRTICTKRILVRTDE